MTTPVPNEDDRKLAEDLFGCITDDLQGNYADRWRQRASQLIAAYRVQIEADVDLLIARAVEEALTIPDDIGKRYDNAVYNAENVDALKMLKNAQAELGRLFISRNLAATARRVGLEKRKEGRT